MADCKSVDSSESGGGSGASDAEEAVDHSKEIGGRTSLGHDGVDGVKDGGRKFRDAGEHDDGDIGLDALHERGNGFTVEFGHGVIEDDAGDGLGGEDLQANLRVGSAKDGVSVLLQVKRPA